MSFVPLACSAIAWQWSYLSWHQKETLTHVRVQKDHGAIQSILRSMILIQVGLFTATTKFAANTVNFKDTLSDLVQ